MQQKFHFKRKIFLCRKFLKSLFPSPCYILPLSLAVFLRHSDTSSARIRMSSVALEPHCCTDKGAWVDTAESDENNISRQRLFAVAYCRQRWHARVTTRAAVWAVLQKERFAWIVLSTLPAAGQTGLNHHRPTMSCENIYILPHQNWKISQVIYTVLSESLWIAHFPK